MVLSRWIYKYSLDSEFIRWALQENKYKKDAPWEVWWHQVWHGFSFRQFRQGSTNHLRWHCGQKSKFCWMVSFAFGFWSYGLVLARFFSKIKMWFFTQPYPRKSQGYSKLIVTSGIDLYAEFKHTREAKVPEPKWRCVYQRISFPIHGQLFVESFAKIWVVGMGQRWQ